MSLGRSREEVPAGAVMGFAMEGVQEVVTVPQGFLAFQWGGSSGVFQPRISSPQVEGPEVDAEGGGSTIDDLDGGDFGEGVLVVSHSGCAWFGHSRPWFRVTVGAVPQGAGATVVRVGGGSIAVLNKTLLPSMLLCNAQELHTR